jgi:tetratricopeptide (TPR) repeat protein
VPISVDEVDRKSLNLVNRKSLRIALKSWDNSKQLGALPLARLNIVGAQREAEGFRDTVIGNGIALGQVLKIAIEALKPKEGVQDYSEKRWRPYLILRDQFLHGRSPDFVCEQLNIARSTYNHEQVKAFEALVDHLRQREHLQLRSAAVAYQESAADTTERRAPFLAPPRPPYDLVGREIILQNLKEKLLDPHGPNLLAVYGLPGVGKTALAIDLANDREMISHFQDGILWAGLGRRPDIFAHLSLWGSALGLPMEDIARLTRLEERAKAVHAAIGMRRMLLVIDDVWDAGEGLAFKIGGPNCAYFFTTRMPRIALELAGKGVMSLHELDPGSGLRLLTRFAPEIAAHDEERAETLVQKVGGLPLALVLMGRYLQREAHMGQSDRLQRALSRLQVAEERLCLAQQGSPLDHQPSLPASTPISLQAVIAISDDALEEEARVALYSLSVFPPKPNDFSQEAALHIAQSDIGVLDRLIDHGLLEYRQPGRLILHQTVAEYAGVKLQDEKVRERFVDYFVRFVKEHDQEFDVIEPETSNIFLALATAGECGMLAELMLAIEHFFPYVDWKGLDQAITTPMMQAVEAARQLGEKRRLATLLSYSGKLAQRRGEYVRAAADYEEALALVGEMGDDAKMSAILRGLGVAAFSQGQYERAEGLYHRGLEYARKAGEPSLESSLLTNLGVLFFNLGRFSQAEAHFREGLRLARAYDDRTAIQAVLMNLGVMAARERDYAMAEAFFQESLELAHGAGRKDIMSFLLTNLGTLANDRGDLEAADSYFHQGLALAREIDDRVRISHLLANLGAMATSRGDFERAEGYLHEGLDLARKTGHQEGICLLLTNLGVLSKDREMMGAAEAYFKEALSRACEMGHRRYQAVVLNNWGELHLLKQEWDMAGADFQQALQVGEDLGLRDAVAGASFGLARIALHRKQRKEARQLGERSFRILQALGHPKVHQVQTFLRKMR